jgi:hypothetical protein
MIKHTQDSIKEKRIAELQAELDARDYRVLKAVRAQLGDVIEEMYPGEAEWYNATVEKINRLKSEG